MKQNRKNKVPITQISRRSDMGTKCRAATAGFAIGLCAVLSVPTTSADTQIFTPDDARLAGFESLKTVVENEGVPLPSNLAAFIDDRRAAEQLGKALFHEMAVGSDGIQSCASCHFLAGADPRSKNQLSPGLLRVKKQTEGDVIGFANADPDPDVQFEVVAGSPSPIGPNYQLVRDDFPFVRDIGNGDNVTEVTETISPVAPPNSNDVASSQGMLFTLFHGVEPGALEDLGTPIPDLVFNVNEITTRRVEPRNTPTTINAVFNFFNFWDGRANPNFNGQNPFGNQDRDARIFMAGGKDGIQEVNLTMKNASLASQAVGPPLSHFEMSFGNGADNARSFPELGRKLITRRALSTQAVASTDSLLSSLAHSSGIGLTETYEELIKKAFKSKYWRSSKRLEMSQSRAAGQGNNFASTANAVAIVNANQIADPDNTFTLMEANFSFFWGLSLMLYEATLVSDETPFDNWMRSGGAPVDGFGDEELAGLNLFVGKGKCANCHGGPEFTNASVRNAQNGGNIIEPMLMRDLQPAMYDNGFYNIGVTPTVDDRGRGESDPFGAPLASSRQFAFKALGIQNFRFPIIGDPIPNLLCDPNDSNLDGLAETCDDGILGFEDEGGLGFFAVCRDLDGDGRCGNDDELILQRVAVDGAFKTPGLRNVEYTAPYFHNGGSATLLEVVQFYNRGGNFCRSNRDDLDPDIRGLGLSSDEEVQLVKFLMALTDPRVVSRAAPFDAPEIRVPDGHPGNEIGVTDWGNGQATDVSPLLEIPAVGANGGDPLETFLGIEDGDHLIANPVAGGVCSPNFPTTP